MQVTHFRSTELVRNLKQKLGYPRGFPECTSSSVLNRRKLLRNERNWFRKANKLQLFLHSQLRWAAVKIRAAIAFLVWECEPKYA
jgi:hypothetical protein